MSNPETIENCHDAMQNVVKAARLLYLFTERMKDVVRIIENKLGCAPYCTVAYPLNSLNIYPAYDSCDSVFASVWRRSYKSPGVGHMIRSGDYAFEIIIRTDPEYSHKADYKEALCKSSPGEPDLVMRIYTYHNPNNPHSTINIWYDLLKPYFEEFFYDIGNKRLAKSRNGVVQIYEEVFGFCDNSTGHETLSDQEKIEHAVDSFKENAEKALQIKLFRWEQE